MEVKLEEVPHLSVQTTGLRHSSSILLMKLEPLTEEHQYGLRVSV